MFALELPTSLLLLSISSSARVLLLPAALFILSLQLGGCMQLFWWSVSQYEFFLFATAKALPLIRCSA